MDWDNLAPAYLKPHERVATEREAKAQELARKFAGEQGYEQEADDEGVPAGADADASTAGADDDAAAAASTAATAAAAVDAAATAAAARQAEATAARQAATAAARADPAAARAATVTSCAPAPAPVLPTPSSHAHGTEGAALAAKAAGNAAFAAANHPAAVALYTVGLASDPDSAALHSNRAAALVRLGLYHEALRDADDAARLDPSWAKAHLRRGAVLAALGRHADAATAYKTAVHFDPTAAATTHDALSTAEAKAASAATGASWGPDPSPVEPSVADALDAKAKGNVAHGAGDYRTALEHYVAAIATAPDDAVLHSNRAAALLGLRAYADAERSARRCVALDPGFARGYGRLGEALRLLGRKGEARRTLEGGLEMCQGNAALQQALDALGA